MPRPLPANFGEKSDSLVVDVGYTALVIPAAPSTSVTKASAATDSSPAALAAMSQRAILFCHHKISPARDGQFVVKQMVSGGAGEDAGRFGFGFFQSMKTVISSRNFHVIEGETEISVEVYRS